MKLIYKILLAFLAGMICMAVSCRMSVWEPHRLVTEPWFLEGGPLPKYAQDDYALSPYIANQNSIGMRPCIFDDYLDAIIGLFLLPKACVSGGDPGEFGGWHIQRVLDSQGRWWRKVEEISFLDIPILLLYFVAYFFGLTYLLIRFASFALARKNKLNQAD